MDIKEFRTKYPEYNDMSDVALAKKLHAKSYSDMPFNEFASRFGIVQTFKGATAGMTYPFKGVIGEGLKPGERTFTGETGAAVTRGGLEVGAGLTGTVAGALRTDIGYRPMMEELFGTTAEEQKGIKKSLQTATEKIRAAQEKYPRTWEGPGGWALNVVGEAIPYMGAAMAGGYAFGPVGAATIGFSVEGQQAYENAIKSGASEEQANRERVIVGSLNAAIEALQIGQLMKLHKTGKHSLIALKDLIKKKSYAKLVKAGGKFTKDVLKNAVSEGLEEFAQEGVSVSVPAALRGDYPKTPDGKPDLWAIGERLGAAALGGATAGGILGAGGAVTLATPELAAPSVQKIEKLAEKVQSDPELDDIQKGLIVSDLKELLPAEHVAKAERQFPEGTVNVWKGKESGKIYPETPEGGLTKQQQTETGGTKVIATDTGEELELDKELSAQAYEEAKRPPTIFDIPEATQQTLDAAKKLSGTLTELEAQRSEVAKEIKKRRGKIWAMEEALIQKYAPELGHIVARRRAMAKAKQTLKDVIPELTETLDVNERETLQRAINETTRLNGGEKNNLSSALHEILDKGLQPKRSSVRLFDRFFGTKIAQAKVKPKGLWGKTKYWLSEITSIPIAIMTSAEQSFGLIQGFPMLAVDPKVWASGIYQGGRATLSDKWLRFAEIETKTNPYYDEAIRAGMPMTEVGEHYKGEEMFRSQLAHRIPVIGKIVAASERGHLTALNRMRSQYMYNWMDFFDGKDVSWEQMQQLADHVGQLSGRARGKKYGFFEKHIDIWSMLTWAPRLYGSWFKTMTDPFTKSEAVRKIAAHDLLRIAALVSTALFLGSIAYPEDQFEQDPTSSDFGKIVSKDGKQHINVLGPASQIIRFVSQMVTGQVKSASTGRKYKKPRMDILARFLRGKTSWTGGVAWDAITGKTFLGKQMDLTDPKFAAAYFGQHVTPMFYQDLVDSIRFQGLDNMSPVSVGLGLYGTGIATYDVSPKKEEMDYKNRLAHEYFGKNWDDLGEEFQTALRKARPSIEQFERATRYDREDVTYRGTIAQEELNAGNRVENKLSRKVKDEMERLQIKVGELNRYSGRGWFLNNKRYKEFQTKLAEHLKKATDQLVNSPDWDNQSPEYQTIALETVIKQLKKVTWQEIKAQANFEDFKRKEDLVHGETTVAAE